MTIVPEENRKEKKTGKIFPRHPDARRSRAPCPAGDEKMLSRQGTAFHE